MPQRYLVFTLLILLLATGASCLLAKTFSHEKNRTHPQAPTEVEPRADVKLSGRSIAPGGAGGRQS
jgi:hypothetical protein